MTFNITWRNLVKGYLIAINLKNDTEAVVIVDIHHFACRFVNPVFLQGISGFVLDQSVEGVSSVASPVNGSKIKLGQEEFRAVHKYTCSCTNTFGEAMAQRVTNIYGGLARK